MELRGCEGARHAASCEEWLWAWVLWYWVWSAYCVVAAACVRGSAPLAGLMMADPMRAVEAASAVAYHLICVGMHAARDLALYSMRLPSWRFLFAACIVGGVHMTVLGDVSYVPTHEGNMAAAQWRVATLPHVRVWQAARGEHGEVKGMNAPGRSAREKKLWDSLSEDWLVGLVDSGASCMFFNHRSYFPRGVEPAPANAVIQTADSLIVPEGVGTAYAVLKDGSGEDTLTAWKDAVLTPTFVRTLISVGRVLECADGDVSFTACELRHPQGESFPFKRGTRRRGYVYPLPMRPYLLSGDEHVRTGSAGVAMVACSSGNAAAGEVTRGKHMNQGVLGDGTLMHHCFGHACPKRIAALHKVTTGLKPVRASDCCDCELCIEANAKHYASHDTHRKPEVWGHFSVDHCVGLPPSYFSRYTCALVATEHMTGWKFVVGCKDRAETAAAFRKLNAAVEALPGGRRVVSVQQDGAKEFVSKEVRSLCEKLGVHQTFSRPYDSNSNAIAERGIRCLFEMVRVMLLQSGLPLSFWWLALSYACVINNLLPNTQCGYESSPMMFLLGAAPAGDVIKPFGCEVIVTLDKPDVGTSVEPKGERGIFVGTDGQHGSAGYRVLVERRSLPKISTNCVFWMQRFPGLKYVSGGGCSPDSQPKGEAMGQRISQRLSRTTRGARVIHNASAAVNIGWACDGIIEGGDDERDDHGGVHEASSAESEMLALASEICGGASDGERKGVPAVPMVTRRWHEIPVGERHSYHQAAELELEAIVNTFSALTPVPLSTVPAGHTLFDMTMLYVDKPADSVKPARKKGRLVFNGAREKEGVDFNHTFSPALRVQCFRLLAAVAAVKGRALVHSDIRNGYLHAPVREGKTIYVRMPKHIDEKWRVAVVDGVRVPVVYRMDKAMYGQHESGREFSIMHRSWFEEHGFTSSPAEPCLFHYEGEHGVVDVCMYIDDCVWCFGSSATRAHFEAAYKRTFSSDFAPCTHFLNLDVVQDLEHGTVSIDQRAYIARVAAEHLSEVECTIPVLTPYSLEFERHTSAEALAVVEVEGAVVCTTELRSRYRTMIGVIMYTAMTSSPQSLYAAARLARALANPTEEHYRAAKHVLRFQLHGATPMVYRRSAGLKIVAFVDSDWCMKNSTSGWCANVAGGPVLFASKKQKCVSLSSTEAEIIAASMATCDLIYLRMLLEAMGLACEGPTALFVDNQGVVALSRDPISTTSMKHVKRRHFFVREAQAMGEVLVLPVATENNVADVLTKATKNPRFGALCRLMRGG